MFVRSIGGVTFEVFGDVLHTTQADPDEYASFTRLENRPAVAGSVRLDVSWEVLPATESRRVVFESDGAWRLLEEDAAYCLEFAFSGSARTRTYQAIADRATSRVRLLVSPALKGAGENPGSIPDLFRYPLDQLLLMHHLAVRGGFIVHAAALSLDGAGLVFPGVSRAGKSTLTELFREAAPDAAFLSDDRVVLRSGPDGFTAWGTPWPGTAKIAANDSRPLRAVLLPVKDPSHSVRRLSPGTAARRLMPMVMCPWYDREWAESVLDTVDRLVRELPCYELRFAKDTGVVEAVRDLVRHELA